MNVNFTYFLAIFSIFSLISCSSDDDTATSEPTQADLIVGSWEMTSNSLDDGNATTSVEGVSVNTDFTWEGENFDYQLNFTENNQVEEEGSFDVTLTYNFYGQTFTDKLPLNVGNGTGLELSGEYTVVNNELRVTNNGETIVATIEELTETSLRLSIDLASVNLPNLNALAEDASGTNKISFTRQ